MADTYAKFLKVRHVHVGISDKLPKKNPIAYAFSDSLAYRNYIRNLLRMGAKPIFKPISAKEYRRLFPKRQKILVHPRVLYLSRKNQIAVIIHELTHFTKTPFHGKKFWAKVGLWYNSAHGCKRRHLKAEAKANGYATN